MSIKGTRYQSMKNARLATAIAICGIALPSCSTQQHVSPKKVVCVNDPNFKNQWDKVKITRNHPIVDVHTHMFNARYLPLKHVVKARMWAGGGTWPLTLLANGLGVLDAATVLLATHTPQNEEDAEQRAVKVHEYLAARGQKETDDVALFHAMTHTRIAQNKLKLDWSPKSSSRGTPEEIGPFAYLAYHAIWNRLLVNSITKWFIHEPSPGQGKPDYASFGVSMMSSEKEIRERVERLFPTVDLFVYQNVDFVPSFYAGHTQAYSYSKDDYIDEKGRDASSLPRIRKMCEDSKGRMIHFVAWNPFRTLNIDEQHHLVPSLTVVKRAISNGAVGVKFYPPLGYRASKNNFKDYKKPFVLSEARSQWKNRYLGNGKLKKKEENILAERAAKLDALNDELFTWCEKHDIPIFTHCNTGEFRAFHTEEYAENANPKYWEPVLKKHPNLRFCFGHAGGVTDWYSGCAMPTAHMKDTEKWGERVRRLCLKYPNVYCEFGIHDDVVDIRQAEHLYHTLRQHLPEKGKGGWLLADKVMYGSDFFMPAKAEPKVYLEAFERLFSLPGMEQYKARFFAGNAMNYLKKKVSDRWN